MRNVMQEIMLAMRFLVAEYCKFATTGTFHERQQPKEHIGTRGSYTVQQEISGLSDFCGKADRARNFNIQWNRIPAAYIGMNVVKR